MQALRLTGSTAVIRLPALALTGSSRLHASSPLARSEPAVLAVPVRGLLQSLAEPNLRPPTEVRARLRAVADPIAAEHRHLLTREHDRLAAHLAVRLDPDR